MGWRCEGEAFGHVEPAESSLRIRVPEQQRAHHPNVERALVPLDVTLARPHASPRNIKHQQPEVLLAKVVDGVVGETAPEDARRETLMHRETHRECAKRQGDEQRLAPSQLSNVEERAECARPYVGHVGEDNEDEVGPEWHVIRRHQPVRGRERQRKEERQHEADGVVCRGEEETPGGWHGGG